MRGQENLLQFEQFHREAAARSAWNLGGRRGQVTRGNGDHRRLADSTSGLAFCLLRRVKVAIALGRHGAIALKVSETLLRVAMMIGPALVSGPCYTVAKDRDAYRSATRYRSIVNGRRRVGDRHHGIL
jgi:hypothetical protein